MHGFRQGNARVGGGARVYKSDGCGTIIKMDDFGKVDVFTGATDMGQGSDTVVAQIVAEELGLQVDDIHVIHSDTDVCPWDVGAHASRTTFIAGNAALGAARKIKSRLLELAQHAVDMLNIFTDILQDQVRQPSLPARHGVVAGQKPLAKGTRRAGGAGFGHGVGVVCHGIVRLKWIGCPIFPCVGTFELALDQLDVPGSEAVAAKAVLTIGRTVLDLDPERGKAGLKRLIEANISQSVTNSAKSLLK